MALVKLTPGELKKANSSTGENRTDILERVIKEGIKIPLVDGSEVILAKNDSNLAAIENFRKEGKAFQLQVKGGQRVISSSDIGKSSVFGGASGGAGGGSLQTAIVESMQCVYLQAMLDNPNKPIEFFTPSVLKKAFEKCELGSTKFDQIRDADPLWHNSAYLSAEPLIAKKYVNKNQVFHRDSNVMKKIYAQKKQAFINSDIEVLSDDKWNPGDIWAVERNFKVESMDTSSVKAYNRDILKAFKARDCVGISLKKVVKSVRMSVLNETNKRPSDLKYTGPKTEGTTARSTFYSGKGGAILYSEGTMEVRPNAALSTMKAEIMGKTARGGGAGWGVIKELIDSNTSYTLPMNTALVNSAKAIKSGNKNELNKFWDMARVVNKGLKKQEFYNTIPEQKVDYIHSKLGVVTLLFILEKSKAGGKANKVVNGVVNYAGSVTDQSSVYIKVYE